MDLKEAKQLLILTHFIGGIDPKQVWPLKAYAVSEDTKTRTILERTELPIINCDQVQE